MNRDRCFWYSCQKIIKGNGGVGGRRMSGDHSYYNIIENGQNTEKSPCCHSNPSERHQLKMRGKTLKE